MVTALKPTLDVLDMEFDDYLCKPVSQQELQSIVTELVNQKNIRNALVELNRLKKKKALVEIHCSAFDLATSKQYAELENRLEELRKELGEATRSHPELSLDITATSD